MTDLKDMSRMVLRTNGPANLPEGFKLSLHITQTDAESVRVFRNRTGGKSQPSTLGKLAQKRIIMI